MLGWQKRHVCAFSLTHLHIHSPQQFRKATTRLLEYQDSAKIKKKNREKHQQKQKNTKISKKPTAIATGRWFPPGVRRVYALAPTMVSLSVISMRNEQFMNSTPHTSPSVHMYSNCETPISLVSVLSVPVPVPIPVSLFLWWVVRRGKGAYWDKIRI